MTAGKERKETPASPFRQLGRVLQGLVLGPLLLLAIIKLVSLAGDLLPFRYQGF